MKTVKVYKSNKIGQEIRRTYDILLKQWDMHVEEKDIVSKYGKTHVIIGGDIKNPPLVLFHGVGDDAALMWIYNAKSLCENYRIYAVDTIGGPGKSEPGLGYDKDFDDCLWIDSVLDSLGIDKAYFAGVSHGGYLVQAYSVGRSERVLKGISISGAPAVGANGSPMKTMLKIFLPEAILPTRKNVRKLIEKLCGSNSAVFTENDAIMEHYTYLLKGFSPMGMKYHNVEGFTDKELDVIRNKVVFLVGTEDPFEKLGGAEAIRKYKMMATFYEDAGHGLNHERADEINSKIKEILK